VKKNILVAATAVALVVMIFMVVAAGSIAVDTVNCLTQAVSLQSDTDEQLYRDLLSHKEALGYLNQRLKAAEDEIEQLKQDLSAPDTSGTNKGDAQAQPTVIYGK
jgi:Skp family chaperone for outer membrane proteins